MHVDSVPCPMSLIHLRTFYITKWPDICIPSPPSSWWLESRLRQNDISWPKTRMMRSRALRTTIIRYSLA